MTENDNPITATFIPSLSYDDPMAAIEWLERAFGFTRRLVVPGPDGTVLHSELSFGNGVVMIGSTKPDEKRLSPNHLGGCNQVLSAYVADPEAHYKRAIEAGAKIIRELRTEEYGARGFMCEDPEGHIWYFGDYAPGAHWE
ncbi:MAG: VOC family protein [Blastocatellia bacterium]|nr:VOC family protein [Blastocatellia bacterium]